MVSVQQVYRALVSTVGSTYLDLCLWHHHLELGTKQANEHYLQIIWKPWQILIISHHNNSPSDAIPSAPAPSADHRLKRSMAAARTCTCLTNPLIIGFIRPRNCVSQDTIYVCPRKKFSRPTKNKDPSPTPKMQTISVFISWW